MEAFFLAIGIMTGNSLNAVDLALAEFTTQGSIVRSDGSNFLLQAPPEFWLIREFL
jgi:1,6-anhydro-N-acetylmuramate kinase